MEDRDKKKAAEVLKEIDSNLDTVLFQFTRRDKARHDKNTSTRGESPAGKCLYRYSIIKGSECQWETANFF